MTHRTPALIVAGTALAALTACSGGTPKPAASPTQTVSAATACAHFRHWYLAAQPHLADAAKTADLILAVTAAPSGQLYKDLSTLEANVLTASKATGSLGQAEDAMLVSDAAAVEQECAAVNPAS